VKHSAFTIFTELAGTDDEIAALGAFLDGIGDDIDHSPELPFSSMGDLHFASFCVVPTSSGRSHLVFEGNVDGPTGHFLHALVATAGPGLDAVYARSVGYPQGPARTDEAVLDYLLAHDIGATTFYVAWPGRSVGDLRREQQLRDRIEAVIEEDHLSAAGSAEAAAAIRRKIGADPELAWAATPAPVPFLVRRGRLVIAAAVAPIALVLLGILGGAVSGSNDRHRRQARARLKAIVGLVAALAVRLRVAESGDDRRDQARTPDWQTTYDQWSQHLGRIREREDVQVMNHMISVIPIKPGRFRQLVLRTVLFVVNLFARVSANKGSLGGIRSIHFARWVITPDGKDLIFLSNFDGSWESYLNEFIDKASIGLTAVWTNSDNAVGFPQTKWLITKGARDEVRFKAFARYSMWPTRVWYSAYPTLTVSNTRNNMAIRKDLFAPLDASGLQAWLRRL
jgi:hypothetical protein